MDAPSGPTFGKYLIFTTLAGGRPVPVSGSVNAVNTRVAAGRPARVSSLSVSAEDSRIEEEKAPWRSVPIRSKAMRI